MYEEVPPGWEVGRVVAVDADSGDLGDVVYSLADSGKSVPQFVSHFASHVSYCQATPSTTLCAVGFIASTTAQQVCHQLHDWCDYYQRQCGPRRHSHLQCHRDSH